MAYSITIDAAVDALNQFKVRLGPKINQTLKQDLEFEAMNSFVSCEYAWVEENVSTTGVLQPYQHQFTPNNGDSFSAVTNILELGKIDLIYTQEQLKKFFNAWRSNWFQLGRDPREWDFPRYMWTQHIIPQFREELNLASWMGVYEAPTPGTASTYDKAFTGFKKKIDDAEAAGKITPIATGAPTYGDGEMVEWVETFCFGLPDTYRDKEGTIYMSSKNAAKYAKDYAKYNPRVKDVTDNPNQRILRVDHFNKTIIGVSAMGTSNRMFFSPTMTDNMIIGTREGEQVYPELRFEPFERSLKCMAEFARFYGFRFWDHLKTNDQE